MAPRYQELNGSHSSAVPTMRNLPLFLFLTGLVIIFYFFYIYQAQGTELSMTREQLELTSKDLRLAKENLIDTKATLEKTEAAQSSLRAEKEDLTRKQEECQSALRSSKLQADSLNSEKTRLDDDTKTKERQITDLNNVVTELKRNNTALNQIAETQETLVQQLKQTNSILQKEVDELKSAAHQKPIEAFPAENAQKPEQQGEHHPVKLEHIVKSNAGAETLTNNAGIPVPPEPKNEMQEEEQKPVQEQAGVLEAPKNDKKPANDNEDQVHNAAVDARNELNGGEVPDQ